MAACLPLARHLTAQPYWRQSALRRAPRAALAILHHHHWPSLHHCCVLFTNCAVTLPHPHHISHILSVRCISRLLQLMEVQSKAALHCTRDGCVCVCVCVRQPYSNFHTWGPGAHCCIHPYEMFESRLGPRGPALSICGWRWAKERRGSENSSWGSWHSPGWLRRQWQAALLPTHRQQGHPGTAAQLLVPFFLYGPRTLPGRLSRAPTGTSSSSHCTVVSTPRLYRVLMAACLHFHPARSASAAKSISQ